MSGKIVGRGRVGRLKSWEKRYDGMSTDGYTDLDTCIEIFIAKSVILGSPPWKEYTLISFFTGCDVPWGEWLKTELELREKGWRDMLLLNITLFGIFLFGRFRITQHFRNVSIIMIKRKRVVRSRMLTPSSLS